MITKQTISINIVDDIHKLSSIIHICEDNNIKYVENTIDVCNFCGQTLTHEKQTLYNIDEEIRFGSLLNYEDCGDGYENHSIMIPNCCNIHRQKFIKGWDIQKYLT